MHAAGGVLTVRGGMTSHAAVVARGLGKPCVVGARTLVLDAGFAADLMNEGFTFVACGTDTSILSAGADRLLAEVKGKMT